MEINELKKYIARGWHIFPLWGINPDKTCQCGKADCSKGKHPIYSQGFKIASTDIDQIELWLKKYPTCNWGLATGAISNVTVLDVDPRHGGEVSSYNLPLTLQVSTGGGGAHYYFQYCPEVSTSNEKIGKGIDIRNDGGYAVLAGSNHSSGSPYAFVNQCDLSPFPNHLKSDLKTTHSTASNINLVDGDNSIKNAILCMSKLSPRRVENYEDWVKVGMSLKNFGDIGLQLWDEWSKKSSKYELGECSKKWETFKDEGLTLGSLIHWAKVDSPKSLTPAPKYAKPEDYIVALKELGYSFRLNISNNTILCNGTPMDDIFNDVIICNLKNNDYKSERDAELAWTDEAVKHSFHPIIDYLNSLKWDGKDHIAKLSSYFTDIQGVFPVWFKRWLIGAVAKVKANPQGQQNRMFILDGKQDLGKSFFVRWLASGVPAYHVEQPINTEDKDSSLRLVSKWIWEVSELGATINKADREALKSFLALEKVTVRKAYGHNDIEKPALANFIGTVNNERGFLNDPTGSRRFMSCTLTSINFNYSHEVDINQVWAQAKHLFESGEQWELTAKEKELSNSINIAYEVESPLAQYILKFFDVDETNTDWIMPTSEIIDILRDNRVIQGDNFNVANNVASALGGLRLEKATKRLPNYSKQVRCWIGIKKKDFWMNEEQD